MWHGTKPNTMLVGADVSHPGSCSNKTAPSMAGVVATVGPSSLQYLGSARLQQKNTEHMSTLEGMMEERILAYRANMISWNSTHATQPLPELPQHILFYRDGVSESQFGMVKEKELPLIKNGCRTAGQIAGMGPDWSPSITLLVVGKRHHTRFFLPNPADRGNGANLQSGLVVDTVVNSPHGTDFYLQSHDCFLGTARSAHYIVLENESNYTMDELQETTNKICYTGSRATKSLSVATPARYADLLCERLRCYIRPFLDHPLPKGITGNLNFYQQEPNTWRAHHASTSVNPWHSNLDDVMFYL
ncbi:stem cell self-renewal protein Piwi [Acephala macrosclerotiorum]|nr:stem cell self-renewal protein Piwi [Acephala macrosclerotiorum]